MRKTKFKSQLLAILLAFVMVVGLVPVPVFADYDAIIAEVGGYEAGESIYVETYEPEHPEIEIPEVEYPEAEYPEVKVPVVEYPEIEYPEEEYLEYPSYEPETEPASYEPPTDLISSLSEEGYITVFVTFEGYNLGHGFYVEPTAVTIPAGSSAAAATLAAQDANPHLGSRPDWVSFRGDTGSGFYMEGIRGFNRSYVNLPSYLANRTPWVNSFRWGDAVQGGNIMEFDFTFTSGWMITVNHVLISMSAGAWIVNDGDVIRWQFSVYGLGADVGVDSGWGNTPPFIMHDRTELIRALFAPHVTPSARNAALAISINPLATAEQVAWVTALLLNGDEAPTSVASSIVITPSVIDMFRGTSRTFAAEVQSQIGEPMPYEPITLSLASGGSDLVELHPGTMLVDGLLTIHPEQAFGTVVITAVSGELTASAVITIRAPSGIQRVIGTPATSMLAGESSDFCLNLLPAASTLYGYRIEWASADDSILTVSPNPNDPLSTAVVAISIGSTAITARLICEATNEQVGTTVSFSPTVRAAITGIRIATGDENRTAIQGATNINLNVTAYSAGANFTGYRVERTVANTAVATLPNPGSPWNNVNATAVGAGVTTSTAQLVRISDSAPVGEPITFIITVSPLIGITRTDAMANRTLVEGATLGTTVALAPAGGGILGSGIIRTSTNPEIISPADGTGLLNNATAHRVGTARIYAQLRSGGVDIGEPVYFDFTIAPVLSRQGLEDVQLEAGDNLTLSVVQHGIGLGMNRFIQWTSSDESIVMVQKHPAPTNLATANTTLTNEITAVSSGTATITAQLMTGTAANRVATGTPITFEVTVTAPDWQGQGTEAYPFLISNREELMLLAYRVNHSPAAPNNNAATPGAFNGTHFRVVADITLGDDWEPIGRAVHTMVWVNPNTRNNGRDFDGIFDGGGHTITFAHGSQPLFGAVWTSAVIRNVNIYAPYIAGHGLIAGVNAQIAFGSPMYPVIDNVRILSGSTIRGSGFSGTDGFRPQHLDIRNSTIEQNVRIGFDAVANAPFDQNTVYFANTAGSGPGVGSFVSGLAGFITNSVSYATVYGHPNVGNVGGLVGYKQQSMRNFQIDNSHFRGEIIAPQSRYVGGILGAGYDSPNPRNNTPTGQLGGFMAAPNTLGAHIRNSTVTGNIIGYDFVGGIVGGEFANQMWSTGVGAGPQHIVKNNHFAGTLTATAVNARNIGALFGYVRSLNRNNVILGNTFAEGSADRGIGHVSIVDTIHANPTQIAGTIYFRTLGTAAENPPPAGFGGITRRNYYRTDNPLGAHKVYLVRELIGVRSISLSVTGTHSFTTAVVGYGAQTPLTITVTNTGEAATGALAVSLSGDDTDSFTLSIETLNSIATGATETFTVVPGAGLLVGEYTATITVANNQIAEAQSFNVRFIVEPANRTALNMAIAEAEALSQVLFTPATWLAVANALTNAITVRDNTNATQNQVNAATAYLRIAIDNLVYDITWQAAMTRGLDKIVSTVSAPQFGSVGGEWTVLALARAGHPVPYGYFETYVHQIGERLMNVGITTNPNSTQNAGGQFPLNRVYNPAIGRYEVRLGHNSQSTENSRLIVALTSLGIDASNFTHSGTTFDLVAQYGQRHDATSNQMWGELQGINGPIWNLIALNSRGWDTPYEITDRAWVGGTTASNSITIDERIQWVLDVQLNNGGWVLQHNDPSNSSTAILPSDPDMTAMALQALAPHRNIPVVAAAINRAVEELSRTQLPNGGWASFGLDNVQSPAQVIVALTKLGIDPMTDSRFVMPSVSRSGISDGYNPITAVLRFFDLTTGGFFHPHANAGGAVDLMATEQAVYSLVAYWRFVNGMNALYNMSDAFVPSQPVVDRTALNAIIANAQARVGTNYTPATWAAMQTELVAAILVRDNTNATQAEVNAAVGRLNASIIALNERPDFTVLDYFIAAAEARIQSNYTPESWARMQDALAIARQVRNDVNVTQTVVDIAAANLAARIDQLVEVGNVDPARSRVLLMVYNPYARPGHPRYFLQGGTVREMYIYINPGETAYSILRRPETGLRIRSSGHHVWAGMYVEAINHWGEFDGGPLSGWMVSRNYVFPARSSSLTYLQDGDTIYWVYTYELGADIIPRFGVFEGEGFGPDRAALRAAIGQAEQRIQSNYTAASWTPFQATLNTARGVYGNPAATQDSIDTAARNLTAAENALVRVGSAGGGGGMPGIWPDFDLEYEDDEDEEEVAPDPEAELDEDMIADGEAVAYVVYELLQQAVEAGAAGVTITVPTAEGTNSLELELIIRTFREAASEGMALTIHSDVATITLDVATLAGIASGMDDDDVVRISAEIINAFGVLNPQQQLIVGDSTAIRLTITVAGNPVSNFRGTVIVSMPYTSSIAAEDYDLLTVYHIDSLGNINEMPGARYDNSHITFTTNHFSVFFINEWISPFADVTRNAWYFRNVRFAYANGLMTGTAPGQFSPDTHLSRAMMVTLLWRMEGMPIVASGSDFHDVAEGRWYSDAIAWASANDIVNGHGDGTFAPNDSITREQLALIFQNYMRFSGADVFAGAFVGAFTDVDNISHWALDAMMWANANGLITGRTITTLAPDGTATRAEAAGILQRFMEME